LAAVSQKGSLDVKSSTIPPQPNCVATLPCATQGTFLTHSGQ